MLLHVLGGAAVTAGGVFVAALVIRALGLDVNWWALLTGHWRLRVFA